MLAVMTACFGFFSCIIVLAVWRQVQSWGLMKLGWIRLLLSVAAGGGEGQQFCLGFSTNTALCYSDIDWCVIISFM